MKKILFGLIIVISLFMITGCGSSNGELSSSGRFIKTFYELKYEEPDNYASVSDFGDDDDKTMTYIYGNLDGSIVLNYQKGSDYSEVENLYYHDHTEEEINGVTWRVMNDDSSDVQSRFYYTVYKDNLYLIELNGIDKFEEDMNTFIKTLSFDSK